MSLYFLLASILSHAQLSASVRPQGIAVQTSLQDTVREDDADSMMDLQMTDSMIDTERHSNGFEAHAIESWPDLSRWREWFGGASQASSNVTSQASSDVKQAEGNVAQASSNVTSHASSDVKQAEGTVAQASSNVTQASSNVDAQALSPLGTSGGDPESCKKDVAGASEAIDNVGWQIKNATFDCSNNASAKCSSDISGAAPFLVNATANVNQAVKNCGGEGSVCADELSDLVTNLAAAQGHVSKAVVDCEKLGDVADASVAGSCVVEVAAGAETIALVVVGMSKASEDCLNM